MSEKPDTSGAGIVMGSEDLAHAQKVREATPDVFALAKDCGVPVRYEPDSFGRPVPVATVPANVAFEAMNPAWKMDTEREMHTQALRPTETMVDARGNKRKVWSAIADQVGLQKGVHATTAVFFFGQGALIRWTYQCQKGHELGVFMSEEEAIRIGKGMEVCDLCGTEAKLVIYDATSPSGHVH